MADLIFPGQPPAQTIGSTRLPTNVDLSIWQGDVQKYSVLLTDADGNPVDLTGVTASAVIRANFVDPSDYEFTCTISGNAIDLYMSSEVSKSIPAGAYAWNLQLTDAGGDVRTYLAGDVMVYAEVDH